LGCYGYLLDYPCCLPRYRYLFTWYNVWL